MTSIFSFFPISERLVAAIWMSCKRSTLVTPKMDSKFVTIRITRGEFLKFGVNHISETGSGRENISGSGGFHPASDSASRKIFSLPRAINEYRSRPTS